ncbi:MULTISPECIES: nucleotide sugar dehydrogenase [Thermotoga]|uniref:Lipopolysaccharide biosynthesis protein n=1 Tax=Thermotoga neapolitana (strain ATCC 49049 / DSM 4359 / NBRC 107923 / NS-E) TaxID=309803 RepID=B9KB61_THENN|nr:MULTISPECIES: nucleotide sugar dehydrogenase [Thermotoga]ACM22257.1 Lipopolysaccharide biosynthesis protein [Thermotoga neapolitana DSM 4359]AJG40220.1 UDP-N-acetyl-D-glucosamine dehydrogenase [Thermotoga sp. RQ7]HBF10347.1 nucleotide sugar dehydrogenase [Thermotoga neapolitana]
MLKEKLVSRTAVVGVIGLGYVGLPLAVEKAKAGYRVIGFDIQKKRVDMVNAGINYIGDVVDEELKDLVEKGMIRATTDFSELKNCDVATICVPTPLGKYKEPDLTYVINTAKEIAKYLHREMLVVLESTTYPGTTEEVVLPILESTGLKVGEDFYLAFSPERVDPGNRIYKTKNTPKVVGGVTEKCTELAKILYENVLEAPVHTVSSPRAAEMSKVLENTFRLVNISLINEVAILARRMGINIWEVIDAAATKPFGFMPFYPGPGAGGHCIPIDPFYLAYKAKEYDVRLDLVEMAGEINDFMPEYVVMRVQDILNERKKPLNGSKVLLLGVAYKGDIDDVRESPALKVWDHLEKKKAIVEFFDPYVPEVKRGEKIHRRVELTEEYLKSVDIVVITTAHKNGVDYNFVVKHAPVVFDTKNITKDVKENREKIILL